MTFISRINARAVVQQFRELGAFNIHDYKHGGRGRKRIGKTADDRESGYALRAVSNKQRPIRCTSSHRLGGQDDRGIGFWEG